MKFPLLACGLKYTPFVFYLHFCFYDFVSNFYIADFPIMIILLIYFVHMPSFVTIVSKESDSRN
jgi:hypothetical protein